MRLPTLLVGALALLSGHDSAGSTHGNPVAWSDIPAIAMRGGLKAYWNVRERSKENAEQAYARGFEPVTIMNTFADYPGRQRENIRNALEGNRDNPWQRPEFFERIVRRNIDMNPPKGIYVHDIEFPFEQDPDVAWKNEAARKASGVWSRTDFSEAYRRQWAEWYALPIRWTKERYPDACVGIYGVQPFSRDYWGVAKNKIEDSHQLDSQLWRHIDSHVDFYIASIYVFYDQPSSVYYMASNVEQNYLRTRTLGSKPLVAYTSMRFHPSNQLLGGRELPPYLVEAMAIVPYFSGAQGIVLWGSEYRAKAGAQPYERLPHFVRSLRRVAKLSEKIGRGRLVMDEPAHASWHAQAPLLRKVVVDEDQCVFMALNPWQREDERSSRLVRCGRATARIEMAGRQTTLAVMRKASVQTY